MTWTRLTVPVSPAVCRHHQGHACTLSARSFHCQAAPSVSQSPTPSIRVAPSRSTWPAENLLRELDTALTIIGHTIFNYHVVEDKVVKKRL